MIAHLDGVVSGLAPDGAVIEVGGVGLLVQCTPGTLAGLRLGERVKVSTSLLVREDSLTLYGFASEDERNVFELLQTASRGWPWPCWPCTSLTRCAARWPARTWSR
jgi:Holliday junction DNA helicase RuvA